MPRRKNPKMVAQPHNMTHFLSPVGDMSGFNKRARTGSPAATARLRHTEEPRDSSDDSSDGSEDNDSGKSGAQPRDSIHAQARPPPPTSDTSADTKLLGIDSTNSDSDELDEDDDRTSSSSEDELASDDSHSADDAANRY